MSLLQRAYTCKRFIKKLSFNGLWIMILIDQNYDKNSKKYLKLLKDYQNQLLLINGICSYT